MRTPARPERPPHRGQDADRDLKLRSAPAHIEQRPFRSAEARAAEAAAARRYLRRRRELLLCALLSVLGVLTARSIPLLEHERERCVCRSSLRANLAGASDARAAVNVKHILHDVTALRDHGGAVQSWSNASADEPVDVIISDGGATVVSRRGNLVLADYCDVPTTHAPSIEHKTSGGRPW